MLPNARTVLTWLLLPCLLLWASWARADVAASVHFVSGQVTAQTAGQGARALAKGGEILGQDRVETAADGRIQMRFTDGGLVSLMPNTVFSVEEYRLGSGAADEGSLVFNMVRGGLRTVTGSIGKTRNENYQLKTPVGTLGIRGTEFIAVLNPPNTLRVHVGRGRVAISNDHGAIEVPAGQSAVVTQGSAPQTSDEQPVFLASAPGSAAGAAAQGQDAGTGRVDRDPYVVLVSYDLPVAAERQAADAGQVPQPAPDPAPTPQPAPEPAPQPEPPIPQPPEPEPPVPEPQPEPEPPAPEPPVPPAPEPPPAPGPGPNPPSPVGYISAEGEYGAFIFGEVDVAGAVATFDANGTLVSYGTAMEGWKVKTQYKTDRSVTGVGGSTATVPDIAIGQFEKKPVMSGFSLFSGGITGFNAVAPIEEDYGFFAIGAGELSPPPSGYLRYSLTDASRQVGRGTANGFTGDAQLRSFELQLKNLGSTPLYDLSMRLLSQQALVAGEVFYSTEQRSQAIDLSNPRAFLVNIPGGDIQRQALGSTAETCTGCQLHLSGVFGESAFGESANSLGIVYSLQDDVKYTEISGAALLGQAYPSRASGEYAIAKVALSGSPPTGGTVVALTDNETLQFDSFLGGLINASLESVLEGTLETKGEIRLTTPAPGGGLQWESSILIGEYKDPSWSTSSPSYLPFAIGSGRTELPIGGELSYSLLAGAPAGRRGIEETSPTAVLQKFDLVLYGLSAAGGQFNLDMAIAARLAAGGATVEHPGYQVQQSGGHLMSLGVDAGMLQSFGFTVDGGHIKRESGAPGDPTTCYSSCTMDVRGVFGHSGAAAVVYRLQDQMVDHGLIQGAAMLGAK